MKILDPAEIRYTQTSFSRSFTRCVPEAYNNSQNISSSKDKGNSSSNTSKDKDKDEGNSSKDKDKDKDKGNSSSNTSHHIMGSSSSPHTPTHHQGSSSSPELLHAKEPPLLLECLLSRLLSGESTIDSIDPISVFFYSGSWYSLDNRRLWVFKQLGKPIPVKITTSFVGFLQKFQEDGDNLSARFLPDPPADILRVCKNSATFLPNPPADKRAEAKTEGQDGHNQSAAFLPDPTAHKRAKPKTQGQEVALLLDHVFQWTTHDIMNDKLLKNKVLPMDSG